MADWGDIAQLVREFDLEGYVQDQGFLELKSGEWVGDCPHCGKERKVAVNIESRKWHCWVCQEVEEFWDANSGGWKRRCTTGGGGVLKLIQWIEEIEFQEAMELVIDRPLATIRQVQNIPESIVEEVLDSMGLDAVLAPEGWCQIPYGNLPYLEGRGITVEDVQTFGLFWCPEGKYRNRVIFPVWEFGRLIYWQARAMWEKEDCPEGFKFVKSLNPPKALAPVDSSQVLMNIDTACRYPRVAVVEGPTDLVRSGPDTVCTFGKQFTPQQVGRLLARGVKAIDLMWDGPTPREPQGAQPEMARLAPWLALFFDTRLVFLPHGDPGDWTRESLLELRASGVPGDYLSRVARL